MDNCFLIVVSLITLATQFAHVNGHGRLMNPPARNSMWRVGFPCPVNYNDNELFCGGFVAHQITNDGKCGLCGDNYLDSVPRPHETGGKFGVALPTRRYYSGQVITVVIELTSNHKGYFKFNICSIMYYVSPECFNEDRLNRNVLPIVYPNGTLARKYMIETTEKRATIELKVLLPPGFNCTRCTFRWTYVTGNSWGNCEDGSQGMGCGKQETFINCADVSVIPMPYNYNPRMRASFVKPQHTSSSRTNQYMMYYRDMTRSGAPMTALTVRHQRCVAKSTTDLKSESPEDKSCQVKCLAYPPECREISCKCVKDVIAREWFRKVQPMADQWCLDQCNVYPCGDCDDTKCEVVFTRTT